MKSASAAEGSQAMAGAVSAARLRAADVVGFDPGVPFDLLDTAANWTDAPMTVFHGLLTSDNYKYTNRSTMTLAAPSGLQAKSAVVYASMFGKYLRHLTSLGGHLLETDERDFRLFLDGPLGNSSRETRMRYVRLIERVFCHLEARSMRNVNPVSAWQAGIRGPAVLEPARPTYTMSPAAVWRLQDWLYSEGSDALAAGDWRRGRDMTLASLSMGSGLRCAELLQLRRGLVKHWPNNALGDRFWFDLPLRASVRTAKPHRTVADDVCVDLLERWWHVRFKSEESPFKGRDKARSGDERLFPAQLDGTEMKPSTLFRRLKPLAQEAVDCGGLEQGDRWVLERGAQGLRRAYVLTALHRGDSPALLTERLGHHHSRAIRPYVRAVGKSAAI